MPTLRVVLRNSEQRETAKCKVYDWRVQQRRLMICQPSIMATNITIVADGAVDLTLCEVLVTATGKDENAFLQAKVRFNLKVVGSKLTAR